MKIRHIKKALTISTAGLVFGGLGLLATAQDQDQKRPQEAPLVKTLKDLKKLNRQLVTMAGPASAATVSLVSRGGNGAGSGVIVSEDGLILTAAHVVGALSEEVIVIFPDGKRVPAKKLGADFDRDAAMVRITKEGSYPFVKVGSSEDLLRNDWCVALGHPGGFDPARTPPLRLGRVLSNGSFVRTDCAVIGGDSGGPLFDAAGEVIAIHSNIGTTLSENRHVPVEAYKSQWEDLLSGKQWGSRFAEEQPDLNRAVLGVQFDGESDSEQGVIVTAVTEKSPAEKAGMQAGDVITKVNGKKVRNRQGLIAAVSEFDPGDELEINYLRGEESADIKVKLARLGDLLPREERPRRQRRPRRERPEVEEPKAEEKPAEEPAKEKPAADEKKNETLAKLLEQALKNGNLELDDEQLEELGGMRELRRQLQKMAESMNPKELAELMQLRVGGGPDEFFASSMKALTPLTRKVAASTVQVQVDGEPVALGTVVSEDGWILTKDTETKKGEVTMAAGKKSVPLKLVKRFPRRDLALFAADLEGLKPVHWRPGEKELQVGALLTTAGAEGEPLGIGLVSVKPRALADVGFLGVRTGEADGGVLIVGTEGRGPAGKAGLKKDDVITAINGKKCTAPEELGQTIRSYRAGDEIEVSYRRGEKEESVKVKLASRENPQATGRLRRMNEMSGPLSERLSGFPEALQHDIPLSPAECGGPLLDLNGRCVGINVSRAGRVKTLAIPARDVQAMLAEVRKEQGEEAAKIGEGPSKTELRATVMKDLAEVEMQLKALEKRLEELQKN